MTEVLMRSVMLCLLLGSAVGVFCGVLLLLRPDWLLRAGSLVNRWVSTRQVTRPMDRQISVDHWLYRYSRQSGAVLMAGALYALVGVMLGLDRSMLLVSLVKRGWLQPVTAEVTLDAMVLLFLVGITLALLVSLFLLFRPSLLRDIESGANQRVSLRRQLKPLEAPAGDLDQYVFRHAHVTGLVLLGGSLYALVMLTAWLLHH